MHPEFFRHHDVTVWNRRCQRRNVVNVVASQLSSPLFFNLQRQTPLDLPAGNQIDERDDLLGKRSVLAV